MPENENKFTCSGDCLKCQREQRIYCSCQHAYSNMRVLDNMMTIVVGMQETVGELGKKIEALQNNEAEIFNPNAAEPTETSQDGDGEEE